MSPEQARGAAVDARTDVYSLGATPARRGRRRLAPSEVDREGAGARARAKEDLKGARADFDEALRLHPRYANAFLYRAAVRQAQGDGPGAVDDLKKALEVAPPDLPSRATVEEMLRKK